MSKSKTTTEFPRIKSDKITVNLKKLKKWRPEDLLSNKRFATLAITECLLNGDKDGAMGVLMTYLRECNRSKLSLASGVPRSTIEHCLQHGNPTIETVFRVMST